MSVRQEIQIIRTELEEAKSVLEVFLNDSANLAQIEKAATCFSDALANGSKILSCGNGGSHCDAMHFAEELTGRYREDRPGYAAIAISDSSHITCVGNDYGYDSVFARYVEAVGRSGDVLLGISTSGRSQTVIRAFKEAKVKGITTISLSGKDGGEVSALADIDIRVAHFGYADRIQEVHIKVIHILILLIEKKMKSRTIHLAG